MMAILERIKTAGLKEYGVYPEDMAEKLAAHHGADALVVALNNADVEGAALQLLERSAQKVFDGMNLTADIIGTSRKILQIPDFASDLMDTLANAAEANGVELVQGIVNVRACAASCITHIVTMAEIADIAAGTYTDGVYLSVNNGAFTKVAADTKLSALVGENVKGVKTGYIVRGAKALNLTVQDANIENGVLNTIKDADCVVSKVQIQLRACRAQSCGKCVFCREGLLQLEAMQKDVTVGKGTLAELDMTKEIGEAMTYSTPCSMGQNASRIALSAVENFRAEYEEHIKKRKCAADVCIAFRKVYVDPTACTGCTKCQPVCPHDAIDGAKGYIHMVFDNWCDKCGRCIDACPENAIHLTTGRVPKLPDRMLRVGRFKA
ncbi:MAG: NADH-ubiquinone oxidoreductase-F iron-sulfur binding region domain-containing protein [Faecousia sp.]